MIRSFGSRDLQSPIFDTTNVIESSQSGRTDGSVCASEDEKRRKRELNHELFTMVEAPKSYFSARHHSRELQSRIVNL